MADTPKTSARIEELRARLAGDPKSRLFYPLAEELRKIGAFEEAEGVLRSGLSVHGSYLSAWISLGRVLKELGRHEEGIEVLDRALALDPGNVVAARLLAESHLAAGNRVEALKKYKLVRALHPADDELEETIERLERDIESESRVDTERVALQAEAPEEPAATPTPGDEMALGADAERVPPAAGEVPHGAWSTTEEMPVAEGLGGEESPAAAGWSTGEEAHDVPETSDSGALAEEEPFGPPEALTAGASMGPEGGLFPEEPSTGAPFEGAQPGAIEEGSPFGQDEASAEPVATSEAEGARPSLEIPPTSADLVGRGRNRARIERLERWLGKIRSG